MLDTHIWQSRQGVGFGNLHFTYMGLKNARVCILRRKRSNNQNYIAQKYIENEKFGFELFFKYKLTFKNN